MGSFQNKSIFGILGIEELKGLPKSRSGYKEKHSHLWDFGWISLVLNLELFLGMVEAQSSQMTNVTVLMES